MNKLTGEQIQEFLQGLTRLSRAHGIVVEACQCCDGVNLRELKNPHETGYTSTGDRNVGWDKFWEEPDASS